MKCSQCRKLDAMDSRWDRIRLKLFHLFHNDIIDLSQDKFTQGFADGYTVGRKHEKEEHEAERLMISELMSEPTPYDESIFPIVVDLERVLTSNKQGQLFLNGVLIEPKKLEQLKSEVIMFKNTQLWSILSNTLNHRAQEIGWKESKELQDLMNAKMVAYTVDVQEKIIEKIDNAK